MSVRQKSSPILPAAVWLIVVLPTLWGLSYTVRNAMKLFTAQPAVTAPTSAGAPAQPTR